MGKLSHEQVIEEIKKMTEEWRKRDIATALTFENISSWFVGIGTGGFLVILSKIPIDGATTLPEKLPLILLGYFLVLLSTMLLKLRKNLLDSYVYAIMDLYKVRLLQLLENPKIIETEIREQGITFFLVNFTRGKYFYDQMKNDYEKNVTKKENSMREIYIYFIFSMTSFIFEYFMIFSFVNDIFN